MTPRELEAKFLVKDLKGIEARLQKLNAGLIQPRVHETNLRYDTAGRTLSKAGRVLRIRQDESAKMTFKGSTTNLNGVQSRDEIEFEIESFDLGRQLLESLGYEVMFFFEKFRTTYEYNGTHVMLDELPFGSFVEVEGMDEAQIKETAGLLGLNWERAIQVSYRKMYEIACKAMGLPVADISFEHFRNLQVTPAELQALPADQ